MEMQSGFGPALKRIRNQKEISQDRLAETAGLSRLQIIRLESGQQKPSWETVQKLGAALGVDCTAFQEPPAAAEQTAKPPAKRKSRGKRKDKGV